MARPKDFGLEHTWRRRLRRQAVSGLSVPEFCAREGVSTASFYTWRRRLAAPPSAAPAESALFVPLQLDPSPRPGDTASGRGFEIELPHHVRLRCDAVPEPEWLGRLVAALAGFAPREEGR